MKSPSTVSKSVKFGLHFAGIWPGTPLPGLHKILWVIFMVLFQGYQYRYIIARFRTESLEALIDSLTIVLPVSLVSIKLTVSWIHHSVLSNLLITMEEDCEKYAAIDTNKLIPKAAELSYRLTTITAVLYPLSAGFYAAGTLAFQQSNDSTTHRLLLNMDLPFETNESPIYELVVTTQFLFLTSSAFTFGIFSALLLMVTLNTDNGLPMLIKSVLFYYVICLEAFIYCFAGEYLDIKSKMIGNTVYESLWYNMEPIKSRQLVLLILRAQKGLPLTFGKFSNLNLESFTSIMKASGSYMSVLLAMS
ncbi:uncharacterized protein LOC144475506 isoform X2 [Augochlora pura]